MKKKKLFKLLRQLTALGTNPDGSGKSAANIRDTFAALADALAIREKDKKEDKLIDQKVAMLNGEKGAYMAPAKNKKGKGKKARK